MMIKYDQKNRKGQSNNLRQRPFELAVTRLPRKLKLERRRLTFRMSFAARVDPLRVCNCI